MSTKDAYKQKIEAELELVKSNLEVLKALRAYANKNS